MAPAAALEAQHDVVEALSRIVGLVPTCASAVAAAVAAKAPFKGLDRGFHCMYCNALVRMVGGVNSLGVHLTQRADGFSDRCHDGPGRVG